MALLTVVAPFLNERESAAAFADFARKIETTIKEKYDLDMELVLVDDGSTDASIEDFRRHLTGDWRIVELSRNFGKEIALFAGFEESRGDYVLTVDADLQHPYSVCMEMIDMLVGDADLDAVYTIRGDRRSESLTKAVAGKLFYSLVNYRQRFQIPANAGDFRIMRRVVVDALLSARDRRRFNKGLYAWTGFKQKAVTYTPDERKSGKTKWSKLSLFALSLEGVTSFSPLPLRIISVFGVLTGILGALYGAYIIVETMFFGADVPGYPSMMSAISLFGGLNLALVGLLGEYIWVTVGEVKNRPLYLVRRVHAANGQQ